MNIAQLREAVRNKRVSELVAVEGVVSMFARAKGDDAISCKFSTKEAVVELIECFVKSTSKERIRHIQKFFICTNHTVSSLVTGDGDLMWELVKILTWPVEDEVAHCRLCCTVAILKKLAAMSDDQFYVSLASRSENLIAIAKLYDRDPLLFMCLLEQQENRGEIGIVGAADPVNLAFLWGYFGAIVNMTMSSVFIPDVPMAWKSFDGCDVMKAVAGTAFSHESLFLIFDAFFMRFRADEALPEVVKDFATCFVIIEPSIMSRYAVLRAPNTRLEEWQLERECEIAMRMLLNIPAKFGSDFAYRLIMSSPFIGSAVDELCIRALAKSSKLEERISLVETILGAAFFSCECDLAQIQEFEADDRAMKWSIRSSRPNDAIRVAALALVKEAVKCDAVKARVVSFIRVFVLVAWVQATEDRLDRVVKAWLLELANLAGPDESDATWTKFLLNVCLPFNEGCNNVEWDLVVEMPVDVHEPIRQRVLGEFDKRMDFYFE